MARVSYVEGDRVSSEVREIYEKTLRGKPDNVHKMLAHRPEMMKNFLPFYGSVGRSLERPRVRNGVYPRFHDQRLPLLNAASYRFVEASRAAGIGLATVESGELQQFLC